MALETLDHQIDIKDLSLPHERRTEEFFNPDIEISLADIEEFKDAIREERQNAGIGIELAKKKVILKSASYLEMLFPGSTWDLELEPILEHYFRWGLETKDTPSSMQFLAWLKLAFPNKFKLSRWSSSDIEVVKNDIIHTLRTTPDLQMNKFIDLAYHTKIIFPDFDIWQGINKSAGNVFGGSKFVDLILTYLEKEKKDHESIDPWLYDAARAKFILPPGAEIPAVSKEDWNKMRSEWKALRPGNIDDHFASAADMKLLSVKEMRVKESSVELIMPDQGEDVLGAPLEPGKVPQQRKF